MRDADRSAFKSLHFEIALGSARVQALQLREAIYDAEFGRNNVDLFDDVSIQVVAKTLDDEIVAGVRVIPPDSRPFELERFVDLSKLLGPDRVPAQIGGLFTAPHARSVARWGLIPLGLLKCAIDIGRQLRVTDFVMRTPVEELKDWYGRAYFTEVPALAFDDPIWGRNIVMQLDFVALQNDPKAAVSPIGRFLLGPPIPTSRLMLP